MDKTRFERLKKYTIEILPEFIPVHLVIKPKNILLYGQNQIRTVAQNSIEILSEFIPVNVIFKPKRAHTAVQCMDKTRF